MNIRTRIRVLEFVSLAAIVPGLVCPYFLTTLDPSTAPKRIAVLLVSVISWTVAIRAGMKLNTLSEEMRARDQAAREAVYEKRIAARVEAGAQHNASGA